MKYILIIGDGMADNPLPELGGRTPLQYAKTPAMDALASAAGPGSVLTIPAGLPAGSDTAILSIFGCDPRTCYTGRAPLEAAATGIKLMPGDVAYRCNMVTFEDGDMPFEEKRILSHSAGSIDGSESAALVSALFDIPRFKEAAANAGMAIYPAPSFRHIAVQAAPDIAGIELTPPHDHLGEKLGPLLPRGGKNAAVLNGLTRLAHELLDSHPMNIDRRAAGKLPANGVWFWAEGTAVELPDFTKKYGKTGAVISAVPLCRGIGALIGLDTIIVEGATGELFTNYEGKVDAVFEALRTRDFAAVHIEAPDECTHDGDLEGKLQAIEWIDSRVVAAIAQRARQAGATGATGATGETGATETTRESVVVGATGADDYRILLLSDHKTLTSTRGHDGSPVPFVIFDSRIDKNTGLSFCEADAATGGFVAEGTELMSMLFEVEK